MNRNTISIFLLQWVFVFSSFAQVYNNGAAITIQPDALLHIQGDFINQGGEITNSGLIELGGNWENTVMTNPLTPGDGEVSLLGASQTIGGEFPTLFNDLNLGGEQEVTLTSSVGIGNNIDIGTGRIILNQNILHLLTEDPSALSSSGGGIVAETADAYGYVRWDIGEAQSNQYVIPFINNFDASIPLTFEVTGAGVGEDGFLLFSTYGTSEENTPLPIGVTSGEIEGDDSGLSLVDRFWIIEAEEYTEKPEGLASFSYDQENEIAGANDISTEDLEALSFSGDLGWIATIDNAVDGNVVTANINQNYGPYTLWSNVSTSVSDVERLQEFKVFPNPMQDVLHVYFVSDVSENVTLSMVDPLGRVVNRTNVFIFEGENELTMDAEKLPTGSYNLFIQGDTFSATKKINKL